MKTTQYLFLTFISLLGFLPIQASVITVTNTADSGPGSLRDAIAASSPGDTVLMDGSLSGGVILLSSGPLVINKNLNVVGLGSISNSINANSLSRALQIEAGNTVLFRGFTLALGLANGAGDAGRGGTILNRGTLTLNDVKVLGGRAAVEGGGIYSSGSLSISRSVIKNGQSPKGAGIYVASGTMNIFETKIEDNSGDEGAGIWFSGSSGSFTNGVLNRNASTGNGGGLFASSLGTLNFSRLTIDGNSSGTDGGAIFLASGTMLISRSLLHDNSSVGRGGGIFVSSGYDIQSENTTYSGNTAGTSGGAAHILGAFLARANTFTLNSAGTDGGAIFLDVAPALRLIEGSIISGNTAASIPDDVAFASRLFSSSYNLFGVNDDPSFVAGTGDLIGSPALLGPLANNGGESFSHEILCGSAALDAANPAGAVLLDQLGLPRNINERSDIGAFEKQEFCPTDCVIDSVSIGAQGACDPLTNTYTQEITIYVSDALVTGSLIVNGVSFSPGTSPRTVELTGLSSTGLPVDLEVYYTNDTGCVYNEAAAWTAPANCLSCVDQTPSNLQSTYIPTTMAMRLSWTPIPGTVGCRLSGRPLGAPWFALVPRAGSMVSQVLVPAVSLTNGTSYEWKVACACSFPAVPSVLTNSSVLDTFFYDNGEPLCDALSVPDMLEANFQSADSSMLLSWNPPSGMVNCRVSLRPLGAPAFSIRSVDGTPPVSTVIPGADLNPGVSYEWKLRCSCTVPPEPGNQTDFSVLDTFVYPALRQGLMADQGDLNLYPNPVQDAFLLEWTPTASGDYVIEVFAADGRQILGMAGQAQGTTMVRHQVNATDWLPGAYWVRVKSESTFAMRHFVKVE